jgi:small conductance mechanosensitive channel
MDTAQVNQWKDKAITYLIENGPKLVSALAIIVVGVIVARFVGGILQRWLNKRDLEPPVRMLITRVVKLVIVAMFTVVALGTCGVNIAPLVAGIGVAGVGVGLAMQGVLGNLVSGLIIIFTKPFRIGEYIEIVGETGQVSVIELFTTTLNHADRSRVIIPNRKIVGEILHNYGNIRQHDITVGVAYDTDLNRALQVIRNTLASNQLVLQDPEPVVTVLRFGDSAIEIAVKPWSKLETFGPAGGEVQLAIADAFRANKISIPFPQREVRMLGGDA